MPKKNSTFGRGRGRGKINTRSYASAPNDENNTPVKVKKEKLKETGHFISPDPKARKFTIKKVLEILRAQDNTVYQESELKEMLTTWRKYKKQSVSEIPTMTYVKVVQELQIIQKRIIGDDDYEYTIDEITAILKDTRESRQYLQKMETEELRQILSIWFEHEQKDKNIKNLNHDQLISELENIKSKLNDNDEKSHLESIEEQVDKETDEMFSTVLDMNVNENTTDEQIEKFTHSQLSYFQYVKSLKFDEFPSLEDVQQYDIKRLYEFCKEWRNGAAPNKQDLVEDLSSVEENDLYSIQDERKLDRLDTKLEIERESTRSNQIEDVVMTDVEDDELEDEIEVIDDKKNHKDDEDIAVEEPEQLSEHTTDAEIKKFDRYSLETIYKKYTKTTAHPTGAATIKLWTKDQLERKIRTARDTLIRTSQTSIMKQNSSLKSSRKYSGKPKIQTDLQANLAQSWRYNLFFTQPLQVKTIEDLRNHMASLFLEMQKYQPTTKLLPWSSTDMRESIDDSESLPTTITGLKKYFPNIRAPTGVTKQYIKMRLCLPVTTDRTTFEADYIAWCNTQDIKMYYCSVQQPSTKVIGWLVYAPNTMDREKWCRATQELYTQVAKDASSIEVGLSWKALTGQWDMPPKDKVYAMHVETTVTLAPKVKTFLRLIAQRKAFPLGVRFRLMDQYSQYMKETTQVKYKYIRDKHKTCLKEVKRIESEKILNLDYKIPGTKMTLRDVVVNIRDNTDGRRIFMSIDARYDRPDVHVAMYRPDKGSKAEAFMESLPTYLQHLYPQASLSRIFTIDAMEQIEGSEFFPDTQTFLTQEDIELDKEIQMDWDDDSFDHLKTDETQNPFEITMPKKLPGGTKLYNFNGDDDTASTIPATSSNLTFTNASLHLYDANSTVSEMSVPTDVHKQIQNQLTKLNADPTNQNEKKSRQDDDMGEADEAQSTQQLVKIVERTGEL